MLIGEAYLHSRQKTALDQVVARALLPVYALAKEVAAANFGFEIYTDTRVGRNRQLVEIPKIRTLDDDGKPLSELAQNFRNKGFDELPQLELILDGVMSVSGRRHVLAEEDDWMRTTIAQMEGGQELLDIRERIVTPAKCGLLSTHALHAHIQGNPPLKAQIEMDNEDHLNASLARDVRFARHILKAVALDKLSHGTNPILGHK